MRVYLYIIAFLALTAFQTKQPKKKVLANGKVMSKNCTNCHNAKINLGGSLKNIRQRRSKEWIYSWVLDPNVFIEENPEAMKLFKKYNVRMTKFNISKADIDAILDYIDSIPEK